MKQIAVIGSGSWGCALAVLLAEKGYEVRLWSFFEEESAALERDRENKACLPGVKFPDNIVCSPDLAYCIKGSEAVISSVPSKGVRSTAQKMKAYLDVEKQIVVSVSKGLEADSLMRLSEVLKAEIPDLRIAALSGPSHAEEVAKNMPTTIVAAAEDIAVAEYVQDLFMTDSFRVYKNTDIAGVEYGGALKNIIALCAGISDGAGFGDNAKAALMTRGITEISRLGVALGAKAETFSGLSGIGDLIVTCTSMHSRNRRAGILIGQGMKVEDALAEVKMVVEGVPATLAAYHLARQQEIEMPIVEQAYRVLFEGESPVKAVSGLMLRDRKHE